MMVCFCLLGAMCPCECEDVCDGGTCLCEPVVWDFRWSVDLHYAVVSLASFVPAVQNLMSAKGNFRESGPLPIFSPLDTDLLPALSLPFSQWGYECEMSSEFD